MDKVSLHVSFAIQLIDDFTNQVVASPAVLVCGEGNRKPIRKSDGCYVFLNCPDRMKVFVSSPCYHEKVLEIDSRERKDLIIKVRLLPDRRYRLPEGTTCILGKAQANSQIRVVFEQEKNSWKLLYDYQRKKEALEIQLFNPSGQDLEGKQFLITDKQGKHRDMFEVQRYDMREQKCYLKQGLAADYKKIAARIYDVYVTDADDAGFYYLPVREKIQESGICRFYVGEEVFGREVMAGVTNKMNLID